jgi:Fur family transcriptional regulator, ferric uptake regulator
MELFYDSIKMRNGLRQVHILPAGKLNAMPQNSLLNLEALCAEKGMRMTDQRRVIAQVLSQATDHPDVDEVHRRAIVIDSRISIATVYRTVRLFEDAGILERHDFRDGRSRYEPTSETHHDHLIDIESGEVIEFHDEELEELQRRIAERLGFDLVDHRMELYGVRKGAATIPAAAVHMRRR